MLSVELSPWFLLLLLLVILLVILVTAFLTWTLVSSMTSHMTTNLLSQNKSLQDLVQSLQNQLRTTDPISLYHLNAATDQSASKLPTDEYVPTGDDALEAYYYQQRLQEIDPIGDKELVDDLNDAGIL